ncbi:MAG: hypothetical protein ACRCT1_17720 [Microcoleaceae cyanobacterium]
MIVAEFMMKSPIRQPYQIGETTPGGVINSNGKETRFVASFLLMRD